MLDHLAAHEHYARLAAQAERLRQLQALLETALPAHLALGARVAQLKRGKIIVHADSGAIAVKLRQLAPRLTEFFVQQGAQLNGIEVRVQPRRPMKSVKPKKTPKILGIRAKRSLTSLAAGLPPASPLRQALARLLANS